jgi:glycosyltransferase involved in cell wall biosynthesis
MKIALLIPQLALGGAEVDMRGMANQLHDDGHDITVYCLHTGGPLSNGFKMPIQSMPGTIPTHDVVIVMGPDVFGRQLLAYDGVILNYVCNVTPGYYSPEIRDKYRFDALIVDSQNTEDHVKSINPEAVTMNHWYFMASPDILQEQTALANKYGFEGYENVVGTLCAHRLVKNVPRLMDAFRKADIPNSVFLIAGSGPETNNWKEYAAKTLGDRCKFVGVVPPEELGYFYGCLDVFMNQYVDFAGGRCLTASEAGGAGCYIITNEHGGAKENILRGNGKVIEDSIFDDRVPKLLREFFEVSFELRLDMDDLAREEYIKRYNEQNKLSKWIIERYDTGSES